MSTGLVVALVLASGVYAFKAAGPLALGNRQLPSAIGRLANLLPAALLSALVIVATIGGPKQYHFDARIVGVLAAALALSRRASFVVAVLVAAAATAATRALVG